MRVLLSGGCKTESIINTIKSKFDSSGDDLFHVNYINNINEIYQRGNYFDKAIIVDQSITKDHSIDNENKLRERVNRFAFECANRGRNEVYMFLTGNEELANIIFEETLAIRNNSIIILKDGPYAVKFFANLIIADISQIPDKLVFKPKEEFMESFESFDNYQEEDVPELGETEEEQMLTVTSFDNMTGASNIGEIRDDFHADEGQAFGEDDSNFDSFNNEENNDNFDSFNNEENNYSFDNGEDLGDPFDTGTEFGGYDNFEENNEFDSESGGFTDDDFDNYQGEDIGDSEIFNENDFDQHTEKSGELPDFTYVPPQENEEDVDMFSAFGDGTDDYQQDENQFGNFDNQDYQDENQFGNFDNQDYQDENQYSGFDNQDYQDENQFGEYDTPGYPSNEQDVNGFNNPGSYRQAEEEDFGMMDGAALAVGGIATGMAAGHMFNDDDYGDNQNSLENYRSQGHDINTGNQNQQYNPGQFDADDYAQENEFNHQNYGNTNYDNPNYGNTQNYQQQPQQPVQQQKKGFFGLGKNKNQPNQQINNQYNQQPAQNFGNVKKLANELAAFAPRGTNICVTGCSGSGVSTISLNLANALANMGFQVLLVDLDTYGKSQSYFYKNAYSEHMFDVAHTRMAINSRGRLSDNTVVLKQGLHLMSMGIGVDAEKPEKILEKTRIGAFINNVKREYNFVIYDAPFDLVTTTLKDVVTLSDNLVMVVETSTHGLVKTMISMCNLSDDDFTATLFNKSQIVFNKERGLKKLLGVQVKTAQNMLEILDDKLQEITGEDYGIYFSEMNIAGIIKDNPNYELAWFEEVQISDTPEGKEEYANLAYSIITRKR